MTFRKPALTLDKSARQASWTRYWSEGALHSCATSFVGNYAGDVQEFWLKAVVGLGRGSRILDVATGNGALPKLLSDVLPDELACEVDAVDLAQVNPVWLGELSQAKRQRIRFHSGVSAEQLPFQDGSIDLVISQFGMEYTDLQLSLAEAKRVLQPEGNLALVIHATDSLIVSQAREELSHLYWMDEAGLIALAKAMCEPMARAATPSGRTALGVDQEAIRLRTELNSLLSQAKQRASTSPCPDIVIESMTSIMEAMTACRQTGELHPSVQRMELMELMHADIKLRLEELVSCAQDQSAVETMISDNHFVMQNLVKLRFPNGEILGWGLCAQPSS